MAAALPGVARSDPPPSDSSTHGALDAVTETLYSAASAVTGAVPVAGGAQTTGGAPGAGGAQTMEGAPAAGGAQTTVPSPGRIARTRGTTAATAADTTATGTTGTGTTGTRSTSTQPTDTTDTETFGTQVETSSATQPIKTSPPTSKGDHPFTGYDARTVALAGFLLLVAGIGGRVLAARLRRRG
jgi:hypothetical protein